MGDFLNTLYGKLIAVLTIIALLLGIATEGVSFFRIVMETKTSTETAINAPTQKSADAQIATERAKTELETAKWAAMQKEAEAKRMKAEECSARMKAMIDVTPLNQIGGKAYEDLYRECDANYATQAPPAGEACVARIEAIFRDVAPKNPHYADSPEVKQWTSDCSGKMSLQQRDRAAAIAGAFEEKAAASCEIKFKRILALLDQATLESMIETINRVQEERKIWENSNCTITGQHNKLYQTKLAEMTDRLTSKALKTK